MSTGMTVLIFVVVVYITAMMTWGGVLAGRDMERERRR